MVGCRSRRASPPGLQGERRTTTCEFVRDVAKPYPSQAIAHVMGAPLEDAPRLHHWSNWIQRQFDAISMTEQKAGIEQAVSEFYEYAWGLVRARREQPGEDLISLLIAAEEQGERLSDVECVNLVLNVLIGGVDTTQSQLAHTVGCSLNTPTSGSCWGNGPSWPRRRSRRRCASSRSPPSPRASSSRSSPSAT